MEQQQQPPPPPHQQQQYSSTPTTTTGNSGGSLSSCLFCCRPWNVDSHHFHLIEDRKRKLESLSRDDSFSVTMFRYILGGASGGENYNNKEIVQRLQRVSRGAKGEGCGGGGNNQMMSPLPLCNTCLGLIYELKELHVTLERIQNLIIDKVKEIKGQFGSGIVGEDDSHGGGEEEGRGNQGGGWGQHYLFPFPQQNPTDLMGEGRLGGGGEVDIAISLKMDSDARAAVEESLGGELNIPSSSQSDCGSSVADGSIDGLNFDGTRRGRRRKPVQLVDNAKKSKHELINHMKGVNKDLFICDIDGCYAFFNTVQGLSQHKRQHFRDSWPICGVCNYTTPWPSAMNRHFSTQHPGVEKDIKRASRRNPSCAFTVNAFIQQNENPEETPPPSSSSSVGGGAKHNHHRSSTSTSHPLPPPPPHSSSSDSQQSQQQHVGGGGSHPQHHHPSPPISSPHMPSSPAPSPSLVGHWKQAAVQNPSVAAAAAAAAAAAFSNASHYQQRNRFCPSGFNFDGGPR